MHRLRDSISRPFNLHHMSFDSSCNLGWARKSPSNWTRSKAHRSAFFTAPSRAKQKINRLRPRYFLCAVCSLYTKSERGADDTHWWERLAADANREMFWCGAAVKTTHFCGAQVSFLRAPIRGWNEFNARISVTIFVVSGPSASLLINFHCFVAWKTKAINLQPASHTFSFYV